MNDLGIHRELLGVTAFRKVQHIDTHIVGGRFKVIILQCQVYEEPSGIHKIKKRRIES